MRMHAFVLAASFVTASTAPVYAQFSSDFPGVPRAATPFAGSRQGRAEFDLTYFNVGSVEGADSLSFGARIGLGRSWRIRSNFEIGFDVTLMQGSHLRPPEVESLPDEEQPSSHTQGLLGYGLKVGIKYRPVLSVTPEGYGYHVAVGAAFQPMVKPLFAASFESDSLRTGGVFTDDEDPIVGLIPQSVLVAVMGSYRSRRFLVDGALVYESSSEPDLDEGPTPVEVFDGIAPRVGAAFRVTPGFAVGGVFWGEGAPPWRDRVVLRTPKEKDSSFGFLLSFGSRPEAGTDLMVMSPTGKFGESVRIYIRTRSSR